MLSASEIVLLIVDTAGGPLKGKTLLQKRGYFLAQLLGRDLGYGPHYYGPFSAEVDDGLGRAVALGFLDETTFQPGRKGVDGFEVRRYDYRLTDAGRVVLSFLSQKYPDESGDVRARLDELVRAGDASHYMALSVAAKTHHILVEQKKPITSARVVKEAQSFGWRIEQSDVDAAATFLSNLDLARKAQATQLRTGYSPNGVGADVDAPGGDRIPSDRETRLLRSLHFHSGGDSVKGKG